MFAKLRNVVIECAEPVKLAEFYRELTGWSVTVQDADWVTLTGDGYVRLAFQEAPGHNRNRSRPPDTTPPAYSHRPTSLNARLRSPQPC